MLAITHVATLLNRLQTGTKNCCAFAAKRQEKRNNFLRVFATYSTLWRRRFTSQSKAALCNNQNKFWCTAGESAKRIYILEANFSPIAEIQLHSRKHQCKHISKQTYYSIIKISEKYRYTKKLKGPYLQYFIHFFSFFHYIFGLFISPHCDQPPWRFWQNKIK